MKFQYILKGNGWAEGFIEINSQDVNSIQVI